MDLKAMPRLHKGHRYILCVTDEVTDYLVSVPIFQATSEEIGEALIGNVIMKYCIPEYIIMYQDSAFMSSLMSYLFHKFDIKIKLEPHIIINLSRLNMGLNHFPTFSPNTSPAWDKCGQNICLCQHLHTTHSIPQIWKLHPLCVDFWQIT